MNQAPRQLGRILVEQGVITREQLQAALHHQRQHGCRLGEALLALDLCGELEIARAVAGQNGIPFIDFQQTPPSPQAVQLVPRDVAVEYQVVPARLEGNRLVVAALNPYDLRLDAVLGRVAGMPVLVASATSTQIAELLARYDQLKWSKQPRAAGPPVPSAYRSLAPMPATTPVTPYGGTGVPPPRVPAPGGGRRVAAPAIPPELLAASEQPQVVQKAQALIADAVRRRAGELFLEPGEDRLTVRCRMYGQTYPVTTLPRAFAEALVVRLKVMTGLHLVQGTDAPIGTGNLRVDGANIQLRASLLTAAAGEILVLKLQPPEGEVRPLDALGLEPEPLGELRKALAARRGLILVAGGVGSGRPTTLYALMRALQESGAHLLALESTLERKLTGYNQVLAGDGTVRSFAAAMQLCLEQNPDALAVGELPDKAAAELACRAAATGQLVLAGSHAPDASAAIARLLDLGVTGNEAAAALTVVVAQRLLPRVCNRCGRDQPLTFPQQQALRDAFGLPEGARFRHGRGCPECLDLGHRDAIGIFEVVTVDEDLRRLLSDRAAPSVVETHLLARGFRSLEEDAFQKAARGLVAAEELPRLGLRVAAALDAVAPAESSSVPEAAAPQDLWSLEALEAQEQEILDLDSWEDVAAMARLVGAGGSGAGGSDADASAAEALSGAWTPEPRMEPPTASEAPRPSATVAA